MNFDLFGAGVVFFVLVGNLLWYYIKYVIRHNGYEVHLVWNHFSDIANLQKLIDNEEDASKKRNYRSLLYALYSIWVVLVAGFLIFAYQIVMPK